jgi:predicted transcriptional regulator of viral defense system
MYAEVGMVVTRDRWGQLFAVAVEQHGLVSSLDARALGLADSYLGTMHARGSLERSARGVYRFPELPVTRLTALMEAVLWVGRDAVLSHDAVLSLHELASANPRVMRVTTPWRVRRSDPPTAIEVVRRRLAASDVTVHEGIPTTTVARALRDCRGLVMPHRLVEAAHEAHARGLVRRGELPALLADLGAEGAGAEAPGASDG